MSLGVVMLAHTALGRAAQVARHFVQEGCPVVVHCDRAVPDAAHRAFRAGLADLRDIRFVSRRRCEWGTWGIVGATLDAAERMLTDFPQVDHVLLASGACLPLRPVAQLRAFLRVHEGRDFIESVRVGQGGWAKGGLEEERFTLRFPFAWRRQRWLFDRHVALQRRLGVRRALPDGLVPHLGSQWWCLSRGTLGAILLDPRRAAQERYFRRVWIPDESFFQTLVRVHSPDIESRSLTLSRFDTRGRPRVFHDDHLPLLAGSGQFMARKIWPGAGQLYAAFLSGAGAARTGPPGPGATEIEARFAQAAARRRQGRAGLYMQGRFPDRQPPNRQSAGPYWVFQGHGEVFPGFVEWLEQASGATVHGRLFHPARAQFAQGAAGHAGALSAAPGLRDYNPCAFLTNLLWATRGTRQALLFHPADTRHPWAFMAGDPNARIGVIAGAWVVELFRRGGPPGAARAEATRLQAAERAQIAALHSHYAKAQVEVLSLREVAARPVQVLAGLPAQMGAPPGPCPALPALADLRGLRAYVQGLRNAGVSLTPGVDLPPPDAARPGMADRPRVVRRA